MIFCNRLEIHDGSKATVFYLWTEKGALLHAKSLNTDKALKIIEAFRRKEILLKAKPILFNTDMIREILGGKIENEKI